MVDQHDAVQDYYASFHERELDRLLTAEGRLEFALTTRLLAPHLPASGAVLAWALAPAATAPGWPREDWT